MRASRRLRCISVALSIALASPPVLADAGEPATSALETYRDIVQRGTSAFVARRFAEARAAFERAFEIHPDPVLVFNIASCWRRDGNTVEALAEYRRFLTIAPSDDARRMLAEETIAALEAEGAPGVTPVIETADTPPRSRSLLRPIGLTTTGIGAVGLTVGIVELIRARNDNDSNNWDGNNDGGGDWDGRRDSWNGDGGGGGDWNNDDDKSERAKRRALIIGGASTAVMTAGVIMYLVGRRAERPVRVTPAVTSDGAQLVFGGRF